MYDQEQIDYLWIVVNTYDCNSGTKHFNLLYPSTMATTFNSSIKINYKRNRNYLSNKNQMIVSEIIFLIANGIVIQITDTGFKSRNFKTCPIMV